MFIPNSETSAGFPGGTSGKEPACQETRERQVLSLGWEDPLEEGWELTPVFLLGKSHGQRNPMGYSPWGHKESDTAEVT